MSDDPRILSPERLAELRRYATLRDHTRELALLAHIDALTDQAAELRQRAERAEHLAECARKVDWRHCEERNFARDAARRWKALAKRYHGGQAWAWMMAWRDRGRGLKALRAEAKRVAASPDVGGAVSLARAILEATEP